MCVSTIKKFSQELFSVLCFTKHLVLVSRIQNLLIFLRNEFSCRSCFVFVKNVYFSVSNSTSRTQGFFIPSLFWYSSLMLRAFLKHQAKLSFLFMFEWGKEMLSGDPVWGGASWWVGFTVQPGENEAAFSIGNLKMATSGGLYPGGLSSESQEESLTAFQGSEKEWSKCTRIPPFCK